MVAALKALDALCGQYDGREALVLAGDLSMLSQMTFIFDISYQYLICGEVSRSKGGFLTYFCNLQVL